jgi:hypothetical protein
MLGDPIFGKGYISIPIDGSFSANEEGEFIESSQEFKRMPIFLGNNPNEVQVQVFVSERTLNSALEVLHYHDVMRVSQELNSTFLKTFWPNFEDVFGNHKRMVLDFYSAEAP